MKAFLRRGLMFFFFAFALWSQASACINDEFTFHSESLWGLNYENPLLFNIFFTIGLLSILWLLYCLFRPETIDSHFRIWASIIYIMTAILIIVILLWPSDSEFIYYFLVYFVGFLTLFGRELIIESYFTHQSSSRIQTMYKIGLFLVAWLIVWGGLKYNFRFSLPWYWWLLGLVGIFYYFFTLTKTPRWYFKLYSVSFLYLILIVLLVVLSY